MAPHFQPFDRPRHDPKRTRNAAAAAAALGLHIFVAYVALTLKFVRAGLERADEAELTWITLAVPEQTPADTVPTPETAPNRERSPGSPSPQAPAPPQAESETAITQPPPGLEVLGAYVACGLPDTGIQTLEDREACERTRALFGDGIAREFVQTDAERALWAKFAQDKRVQDAGVFSVCSNRGGVTVALTIRLIGGAWHVGDASNAQRKADTNILDDSNMPGVPQFGCDTPEGALFKPWLR